MKKAAIIAISLAVVLFLPLLMLIAVASVGGIAAAACTPTTPISAGAGGGAFGIGTLNWRGASHYKRNPHPGEQPYSRRVPNMVDKIDASGASIIGFQEFETPQARDFLETTRGHWAIARGRAHGQADSRDAIAYQPGRWRVDQVRYVPIRYGGPIVSIPLVRFTSTTGAGTVWVLNTHNPANVVHGTNTTRDSAVRAEASALRKVEAAEPGTPLFLTGDMNDRARFKRLFLSSVGQGWSTADPTDRHIDAITGGPGVTFSDTVVDQSTNDNARRFTDHPFVHATVQLPGSTTVDAADITGGFTAPAQTPAQTPALALKSAVDGSVHVGQWTLNADQHHNAQTIVATASSRGGSQAALVIITAALAESGLSSDPGSLGGAYGVLQQTPSAGWGTQAQVMNVTYATNGFLDHLAKVPGWRSMRPWEAAQAVQRSGAGKATNGRANYGPKVPEAKAIVAALGAGIVPAVAACAGDIPTVPAGVQGHGDFTSNTQIPYVGPYEQATLMSRMQQVMARNGSGGNLDPFFGTEPDGSWYHDCQHFVANLDDRSSSGYGSAQAAWSHFRAAGAAHPANSPDGMSPPVGAWLYFSPNHVVVYLGNNLLASTDTWGTGTAKIGPVSDITNGRWHLPYLGWVAPWGATGKSPIAS